MKVLTQLVPQWDLSGVKQYLTVAAIPKFTFFKESKGYQPNQKKAAPKEKPKAGTNLPKESKFAKLGIKKEGE